MHGPVRDPKSNQSSLRFLPKRDKTCLVILAVHMRRKPNLSLPSKRCVCFILPASECARPLHLPSCALIMHSTRGKQGCTHEGLSPIPTAGFGTLLGVHHVYYPQFRCSPAYPLMKQLILHFFRPENRDSGVDKSLRLHCVFRLSVKLQSLFVDQWENQS